MDIKRLKRRKNELGYTNEDVARLSGVPLGTVQKVMGETTKSPRRDTVLALARVLDPELAYDMELAKGYGESAGHIREEVLDYYADDGSEKKVFKEKEQGQYTLEDYYLIPEERRVELIDGVIYDMTAPSGPHQVIAGEVYRQLSNCAIEHDTKCFPMISPVDVQLDRDNKTMIQPDVIIVCDEDLVTRRVIFGAPEFTLEVISNSSRGKDQVLKLAKYHKAGVKEYWIVDLEKKRVITYCFEKESWPEIYSFDDKIPVGVSDGLCEIDFKMVSKRLEQFKRIMRPGEKLI